jgi:hypothetical protein
MLPIPTIPTDTLHRFLALGGLLIIFFPQFYLVNKRNELDEQAIHLKAERDIMSIQRDVIEERRNILFIKITGKNVSKLSYEQINHYSDSLAKINKFAGISFDSAFIELKRINRLETQQKITEVHIREKNEIINYNNYKVIRYTFYSFIFMATGGCIAICGFLLWYRKEVAEPAEALKKKTETQ